MGELLVVPKTDIPVGGTVVIPTGYHMCVYSKPTDAVIVACVEEPFVPCELCEHSSLIYPPELLIV